MQNLNEIGLDKDKAKELVEELNELLANYSIFYQNVRGYHWNIKGEKFFELHVKFEELYNDLFVKIDEIAERILTLGGMPNHNFSEYAKTSIIDEATEVCDGLHTVMDILGTLQKLIIKQRSILTLAGKANDEGTSSMVSDYIGEQEKLVWMYSSFLNN